MRTRFWLVGLITAALLSGCTQPLVGGPGPAAPNAAVTRPVPPDAVLNDIAHVAFVDDDHGYVVLSRCAASPCETWVATTVDGGYTWNGSQVSGVAFSGPLPRVFLHVIDQSHAVLVGYDHDQRWVTTDSGLTWTQSALVVDRTLDEAPAGALIEARYGAGPQEVTIELTLPDTSLARLANAPTVRLTSLLGEVVDAADGSLWLRGGTDERAYVFVSRDRGRSWREVPLPGGPGVVPDSTGLLLGAANGKAVYLVDSYAYRVWRTHDDGAHWESLQPPWGPPMEDRSMSAQDYPDGRLAVFDRLEEPVYDVQPNDTTFRKWDIDKDLVSVTRGPHVRMQRSPDGKRTTFLISDHGGWGELPFKGPSS